MSYHLVDRVFDLDLPHNEKWVLAALARRARDDGTEAFPSKETLMRWTGYSESTVQRALSVLRRKRIITVQDAETIKKRAVVGAAGKQSVEGMSGDLPADRRRANRHTPTYRLNLSNAPALSIRKPENQGGVKMNPYSVPKDSTVHESATPEISDAVVYDRYGNILNDDLAPEPDRTQPYGRFYPDPDDLYAR